MRSKLLIAMAVLLGIIGVGVGVGFLASRGSAGPPPSRPNSSGNADTGSQPGITPDTQPVIVEQNPSAPTNLVVESQPATPDQTTNIAATTNLPPASTNWEDKIDDIVGSDDTDTNKVKQLFALFSTLPADGQEEVVQHLSNLVEDDNYGPLGDLLKNPNLPEGVLDELLADALNRPNSLKLPVLLDVAQEPNNAKHDEAKDLLELYLGDDYGTNWSTWQTTMNTWLQQNPD